MRKNMLSVIFLMVILSRFTQAQSSEDLSYKQSSSEPLSDYSYMDNVMGFVKGGSGFDFTEKEKSGLVPGPYLQFYAFNTEKDPFSFFARLNYYYNADDFQENFDPYTIDHYYFHIQGFDDYDRKRWWTILGTENRSFSPVFLNDSELRGLTASYSLPLNSDILKSVDLYGYYGVSENDVAGQEETITNDDGIVTPREGLYRKRNAGAAVKGSIGDLFSVEQHVSYFFDDPSSLETGENYLAENTKTLLLASKASFDKGRDIKARLCYAFSSFYDETDFEGDSAEQENRLRGHAIYAAAESEPFDAVSFSLSGRWIAPDYRTSGADIDSDRLSGNFKVKSWFRIFQQAVSLSSQSQFERNNALFNPSSSYLTFFRFDETLNYSMELPLSFSFVLTGGLGTTRSLEAVGGEYEDVFKYNYGGRLRWRYTYGTVYDYVSVNGGAEMKSEKDSSLSAGVTNERLQDIFTTSLSSVVSHTRFVNSLNLSINNIRMHNPDMNIRLYKAQESFQFRLKPSVLHLDIQYALSAFYLDDDQTYVKNLIKSGVLYYFRTRNSLGFSVGYEIYDHRDPDEAYHGLLLNLSYEYSL